MRVLKEERGRDHLPKQELGMDKVVCIEGALHNGGLPSFWSEPSERTPMTKARAGARRGGVRQRKPARRVVALSVRRISPWPQVFLVLRNVEEYSSSPSTRPWRFAC